VIPKKLINFSKNADQTKVEIVKMKIKASHLKKLTN